MCLETYAFVLKKQSAFESLATNRGHGRPRQVGPGGLSPAHQGTDAHQEEEHQAQGDHPEVVEARADGDLLGPEEVGDQRPGGRAEHEEHHPEEHPVVQQEHELRAVRAD